MITKLANQNLQMPPKCTLHRAKIGYCTVNVRHGLVIFLDLLQKIVLLDFQKKSEHEETTLHTSALLGGFFGLKISNKILFNSRKFQTKFWSMVNLMKTLRELTKDIGSRLSGSSNYEKSADWAMKKLLEAGADQVWFQPVMVNVWTRGDESLKLRVNHGKWKEVKNAFFRQFWKEPKVKIWKAK